MTPQPAASFRTRANSPCSAGVAVARRHADGDRVMILADIPLFSFARSPRRAARGKPMPTGFPVLARPTKRADRRSTCAIAQALDGGRIDDIYPALLQPNEIPGTARP